MSLTTYTEPDWTSIPENLEPRASVFSELPFSPTQLKALLVRLTEWHFGNPSQLYNRQLGNLQWTDSPLTTKILIGDSVTEDPKNASKRPAICIRLDSVSPSDVYINPETLQVSIDDTPVEYPVYHKLLTGVFQAVCESTSAPEAERIAEELFRFFTGFSPAIKADAQLRDFTVTKLDGAVKREKGVERHAATVTMTYSANAYFRVPQEKAW